MAYFEYEGHRLAYTIHGTGARTTVLTPGLLLAQKMQTPLAGDLTSRRLTRNIAAFVDECWTGAGNAEPASTAARS